MKKTETKSAAGTVAKKTVGTANKTAGSAGKTLKKAAPVRKAAASVQTSASEKAPAKKAAAKVTAKVAAPEKAPAKKAAAKVVAPAKASAKKAVHHEEESVHVHRKLRLTKSKQKHYINLLMDLRHDFMQQLKFHQDDALSSKKDAAGERAGMATHMADLGTDNFRHDVELELLSDEGDVVEMIDEALQRIKDSEYGICLDCACEINPERLEAKPYARYCTKCKSRREQMEDPSRRHR